ncbi:MAG: hypothetical protein K8R36_19015 [Planctomycetales bacterium]|nr:hypothetical protein [Planctomycetales bacterium]
MAGALVQPLGGFSLVGVAGLGLILTMGWRLTWQARANRQSSLDLIAPVLPGIAIFMLLCVLSLPGTANWALMLMWLAFFTSEAVWWWTAYAACNHSTAGRTAFETVAARRTEIVEVESRQKNLPDEVFQQVTRCRHEEQERVTVLLRTPFAVGQRVAVAHVAFCPPLDGIPDFSAEVTDGPDATVAFTNIQSFGLRLEVRLEEPADEACSIVVEVAG